MNYTTIEETWSFISTILLLLVGICSWHVSHRCNDTRRRSMVARCYLLFSSWKLTRTSGQCSGVTYCHRSWINRSQKIIAEPLIRTRLFLSCSSGTMSVVLHWKWTKLVLLSFFGNIFISSCALVLIGSVELVLYKSPNLSRILVQIGANKVINTFLYRFL